MGGAATFLLNFLRALDPAEGRMRIVLATKQNDLSAELAALGADVCIGEIEHLIFEDRLAWIYRQVADYAPHVVLASLGAEGFEILRLVPEGVVRIGIIQAHETLPYAMSRLYARWVDAMVGVSPQIAAHLRTLPEFAGTRVEGIPYGIQFEAARPREPRPEGTPLRVLYLGRLIEEQKRISRIVTLIHDLAQGPERVTFTLAGSGPQEAEVRAALAGCETTRLTGLVRNDEVQALLRAHDVLILLSDYEGLPLSLLEAMGHGVVPVVSDLPSGMAEAVGTAGILIPVGETGQAAAALRSLARDPARLAGLSAAAQDRARNRYSADRMVQEYLRLARELGAGRTSPVWPAAVNIPAPLGLPAWQFAGLPRLLRRWIRVFKKRTVQR